MFKGRNVCRKKCLKEEIRIYCIGIGIYIFSNQRPHTVRISDYKGVIIAIVCTCGQEGGQIAESCFHLTPT